MSIENACKRVADRMQGLGTKLEENQVRMSKAFQDTFQIYADSALTSADRARLLVLEIHIEALSNELDQLCAEFEEAMGEYLKALPDKFMGLA